ncbi:unnamed protein product [Nesidiocoris tenuis]|uniref:Uncharacterized protein n=1 Tax=Nesidiocoris tenuis TaxID=355587 RepID=A0A6H5HUJ5_9HEMI|nr:unnamed protein product [Nesidiocoris tenuis]
MGLLEFQLGSKRRKPPFQARFLFDNRSRPGRALPPSRRVGTGRDTSLQALSTYLCTFVPPVTCHGHLGLPDS